MYMIRSKSRLLCMRDRADGKMKDVGPRRWVPFEVLPAGMSPDGDGEVNVKFIECKEDLAAIEAENARFVAEDKIIEAARVDRKKAMEAKKAEELAKVAGAVNVVRNTPKMMGGLDPDAPQEPAPVQPEPMPEPEPVSAEDESDKKKGAKKKK